MRFGSDWAEIFSRKGVVSSLGGVERVSEALERAEGPIKKNKRRFLRAPSPLNLGSGGLTVGGSYNRGPLTYNRGPQTYNRGPQTYNRGPQKSWKIMKNHEKSWKIMIFMIFMDLGWFLTCNRRFRRKKVGWWKKKKLEKTRNKFIIIFVPTQNIATRHISAGRGEYVQK